MAALAKKRMARKSTASTSHDKWAAELAAVDRFIDNDYLAYVWKYYKFPNIKHKGKPIVLDSNINVYEACFISQLVSIYLDQHMPASIHTFNILEIGLAYGTSTIAIMNKAVSFKHKIHYDSIDFNQTRQWHDLGMKNIANFLSSIDAVNKIDHTLTQGSSIDILPTLKKKYDIIFIDGSHAEDMVIQDLENSHKLLKPGGLMIIDDVLHGEVKLAMLRFQKSHINELYDIVHVNNGRIIKSRYLYGPRDKRSYDNPNSMYCLRKK